MLNNKILVMNRGDTLQVEIDILDPLNNTYLLQPEDVVYFGLMDPHQMFEQALVKKRFTAADCNKQGKLMLTLKPEDTLDLYPGVYYYAVKLHKVSTMYNVDEVITIIKKTKFIIND